MERGEFIKSLVYAGIALHVLSPIHILAQPHSLYTLDELTGKGGLELSTTQPSLQITVDEAFQKMKTAALKDGIDLKIVSGYRSYHRQKTIYENKFKQYTLQGLSPQQSIYKIIEYSTLPGTSRHHWGTDLDLIDAHQKLPHGDILNPKHFERNGVYKKMKQWLNLHSTSFGFYEVYTAEKNRKGFQYEPWHFSYKPIAVPMLDAYLKLPLEKAIDKDNLMGNEALTREFLEKYYCENILDIHPDLIP